MVQGGRVIVATRPTTYEGQELTTELAKASESFGYFLKSHVRIAERTPAGHETGVIPWEWWPLIHDPLVADLDGGVTRLIVLKARQLGVSWSLAAWMVHGGLFQPNALLGGTSAGELEAAEFVWKCRFIIEHLPYASTPSLSIDNSLELEFTASKGRIIFFPSTPKAGRGYTFTRWISDEAAFHQYAARNFAAYSAATTGQIVIVSSAGDDERRVTTDWFQRMWLAARDQENGFTARFYPPSVRPGRDDAWKTAKRAEMSATPGQYEREHPETPEQAFSSMLLLRFDTEAIEEGLQYTKTQQPIRMLNELPDKLRSNPYITVWATPRPGVPYVIGSDGSKGVGADYADTVVMEARTLRTVAELRSNRTEPTEFGEQTAVLAKWYNDAWCMVGRKWGESIIVQLVVAGCKVYHERTAAQVLAGARGIPGFDETGHSKPALIDGLAEAVKTRQLTDPSPYFWQEASVYIVDPDTGKTEAATGSHDDTVTARALAVRISEQPGAQTLRNTVLTTVKPKEWGYGQR